MYYDYDKWAALAEHVQNPANAEIVSFAIYITVFWIFIFIVGAFFGAGLNFLSHIGDKIIDLIFDFIDKKRSSRSSSEERDDSSELPEDK